MALFQAFDISASGMTAERFRMDTIAENIVMGMEPVKKVLGCIPVVDMKKANQDIRNLSEKHVKITDSILELIGKIPIRHGKLIKIRHGCQVAFYIQHSTMYPFMAGWCPPLFLIPIVRFIFAFWGRLLHTAHRKQHNIHPQNRIDNSRYDAKHNNDLEISA